MILADRLRELRIEKGFSQGEIEKRTGLLRCYLSRCENGHTVPSMSTLEKWASALEVPLYQLFHDGKTTAKPLSLAIRNKSMEAADTPELKKLRPLLAKMNDKSRHLLLRMGALMVRESRKAEK